MNEAAIERMRNSSRSGTAPWASPSLAAIAVVAIAAVVAAAGLSARRLPLAPASGRGPSSSDSGDLVATFSIVAFDPQTGDLGVAVQSKFFAVGRVVPFAAAGVGAIATQSQANTTFGPRGLEMLRQGRASHEAIDRLLAGDPGRDLRQVAIVDAAGNAANFTGSGCLPWAGARQAHTYSVQGNLLAGPQVVDAMAAAFEDGSGDLATRMLAALAAGQAAGGDVRGRQSAALLVVREGEGYGGFDDRYIDLRVDDHETPLVELQRLLDMRHARVATEEARRLLQASTNGNDPSLLPRALEQALSATRLDPRDGWSWLTLAEARLAAGDLDEAAAAGVLALDADPWIKTAVLGGVAGSVDVIEKLLSDGAFRRAWESIPSR